MVKNTINVNGIEYIKKTKYDILEKKKLKVIRKEIDFSNLLVLSPDNTMSFVNLDFLEGKENLDKIELSKYKEISIFKSKMLDTTEENENNGIFNPRIKIGKHIYSCNLIEEAKRVIKSMGYDDEDVRFFIHSSKTNEPLLMKFFNVGVLIAPRVETEETEP